MKMQETILDSGIYSKIAEFPPFSLLAETQRNNWFKKSSIISFGIGEVVLRSDELPSSVYVVLKGEVRLLGPGSHKEEWKTLSKRGSGQLLGWPSLLRAGPCELVMASRDTQLLSLPSDIFIDLYKSNSDFRGFFDRTPSTQENYYIAHLVASSTAYAEDNMLDEVANGSWRTSIATVAPGEQWVVSNEDSLHFDWYVSTVGVPGYPPGTLIKPGTILPTSGGLQIPLRIIGLASQANPSRTTSTVCSHFPEPGFTKERAPTLEELGIREADHQSLDDRFPVLRAHGDISEAMAVLEMICLEQNVPFRRDGILKILEDQTRRDKSLNIQLLAALAEVLGFSAEIATVNPLYLSSVEQPAILLVDGSPSVYFGMHHDLHTICSPAKGKLLWNRKQLLDRFRSQDQVLVALVRRTVATPSSRFGWNWFIPLLKKYKWSLLMVFGASLLAQLFNLGIPLLIQQLIDKVLAQGNLSSLNIIGLAIVLMALFRGVLTILRTYIFVDTTDRMDLTLGSAVIDRLLSLPLSYFEKRPVGELSQRLGELNTIRSFLTGTALISILNIIFASLYLIVMIIYSPLLTAVALSTLPFYLLLVIFISPVYKSQIRKRAIAQARTQSHLIEVIGGIQTVKAQNFELTARWRWQDKYRHFVEQGFKSTALGTSSSEVGNFLNQLSSLLVLWVGMWLVLKGQMTLGMLIAFRIISGYVIGPITQLSGLYQGIQGVQLSMERLSDIIDQNSESGSTEETSSQISLPPIDGNIKFDRVTFGFDPNGIKQLDSVSIEITSGSFVGIVGQSGSGKSTLMKLLPRLYDPQSGRILIDNYDISKVNLQSLRRQIGIVPQDSLLFEGTIAENIALNDPQASSESIISAAKIACAHDFIMSLGKGYATTVSERGSNLSGGQRQRIAIARTILANPQLLVMDEATSALDLQTERELCFNLQNWSSHRTVFFITHRLATVRSSDIILVMHEGRLVESGTHNDLMDLKGRYWALYRQQEMSA